MREIDIGHEFGKLINATFINHRGCVLERSGVGFTYRERFFANLQEVDEYINSRFEALGQSYHKSINKLKNEHQEKVNDPTSIRATELPEKRNQEGCGT
jgi:hypothetical protein